MRHHRFVGFAILLSIASSPALAASTRGAGRDLERGAARVRLEREAKVAESALKSARVLELSQRLGMPSKTLRTYLKARITGRALEEKAAWGALLEQVLPPTGKPVSPEAKEMQAELYRDADLAAGLARSYIELTRQGSEGEAFRIDPGTLAQVARVWTPEQKANFAATMELAAEKVRLGQSATLEDAFELALKEQGRLEEFNKGCKR